jgi:hypothetical protein
MRGVDHYKAASGFHVIGVDYFADPEKDPLTTKGSEWYEKAPDGYVGGVNSTAWRREMMRDWDAAGGELVYPQFDVHKDKIIVVPFEVPESWHLYGGFDYGHRNPSSFHIYAIDHDGNVWVVWEYYRRGEGYRNIAKAIRACPFFNRLNFLPVADPSIWALNQQQTVGSGNPVKSIAQLFMELPPEEQVLFVAGKSGGDITVAEKVNGFLWNEKELRKGAEPRLKVFATCPMWIWEFNKLRYADWSGTMQETRNTREGIVDKDNHAHDDFAYFMLQFFMSPTRIEPEEMENLKRVDPVSYGIWKNAKRFFDREQSSGQTLGEFDEGGACGTDEEW